MPMHEVRPDAEADTRDAPNAVRQPDDDVPPDAPHDAEQPDYIRGLPDHQDHHVRPELL